MYATNVRYNTYPDGFMMRISSVKEREPVRISKEADRFEFTYDMKQLYRVIHSIPEEMKVPFQMFVAGFKYREIAEKLGLPMGTAYVDWKFSSGKPAEAFDNQIKVS